MTKYVIGTEHDFAVMSGFHAGDVPFVGMVVFSEQLQRAIYEEATYQATMV